MSLFRKNNFAMDRETIVEVNYAGIIDDIVSTVITYYYMILLEKCM
jgi:hypothetical protein